MISSGIGSTLCARGQLSKGHKKLLETYLFQNIVARWDASPKADLKETSSHVLLNVVDCLTKLFDNSLGSEGVNIEVIGGSWEDKEGHNGHIAALFLEKDKEPCYFNVQAIDKFGASKVQYI